jgi:periplasmic divalent cation tolerance protein
MEAICEGVVMDEFIQISTTVEQKKDAETIANELLQKRLAACVQIVGPVTSYYWWNGTIDQAAEYLCLIKSRQDLYLRAEAAIRNMHPYEVPEIIATPIVNGSRDYKEWLAAELSSPEKKAGAKG